MSISRPTTPLRRLSRGSLSALSQSRGASQTTPLSFLEGALGNLSDETSILASNLQDLSDIHDALNTFNEGFGMFLYGLKAAAYCIEWSEAPQEDHFLRAKEREAWAQNPNLQGPAPRNSVSGIPVYTGGGGGGAPGSPYSAHPSTIADQTYMTQDDDNSLEAAPPPPKAPLKSAMKKSTAATGTAGAGARPPSAAAGSAAGKPAAAGAKPRITLAQKKKREKYAEEIIETLPLEYRGGDPAARRLATSVIMALIAAGSAGTRIGDIVRAPDLPQAKVNKCLITLSNAKHVVKTSNNGIVYTLDPSRHSSLP